MARSFSSLGRQLGSIAREQTPRLVRQVPKLADGIERSGNLVTAALNSLTRRPDQLPGRPVTSTTVPTAERARQLVYAPSLDGRADPGEIVWTWVTYEEDPSQGKDRPVLVVGRGTWDQDGRPSWVRLDRVLDVPEAGIRREGAILERKRFDLVAHRLVAEYRWR